MASRSSGAVSTTRAPGGHSAMISRGTSDPANRHTGQRVTRFWPRTVIRSGAPDLITVRGQNLVTRCPVCLFAGSLVPREIIALCPPGARVVDTAPLDLDAITAEFVAAHQAGLDVARLHSGDLSVWSAMGEQIRRLESHGIPYTVTPGVPSFAAAAAVLGRELTLPGVAQTVVLTLSLIHISEPTRQA